MRHCLLLGVACIVASLLTNEAPAAPPLPPAELRAADHPNDAGQALDLRWRLSPDDDPRVSPRVVAGYEISRAAADGSGREIVGKVSYGVAAYTDDGCQFGVDYLYEVVAIGSDGTQSSPSSLSRPVRAVRQWFDHSRTGFAAVVAFVCGAVLLFTWLARRGKPLYVRRIAALEAIDEAVGRATEMGRPCLFVPGSQDMNEIGTVAGITVLSHVAKTVAEYDASIVVPTSRSLVMTAARETVAGACLAAGRPEAYDENSIYYVSDEQFAYVAHLSGYSVREKPAACFYLGVFYGESLILAETGSSIGALQIAGTSESSQLPFFVAACDYTLIGEELFAASAYLSNEPDQLGSLKGQDLGKLAACVLLLCGCLAATVAALSPELEIAHTALSLIKEGLLGRGGPG